MRRLSILLLILAAGCGEPDADATPDLSEAPTLITPRPVEPMDSGEKLNLNTAPESAFDEIPGVDGDLAKVFERNRPYISIERFRRALADHTNAEELAALEAYVYVPVNRNGSDSATIAQIPGIDEAEALQLIGGRPYVSNEAFLNALAPMVTSPELADARTYLLED